MFSVTDACLPNPCLNGGECINEDGKAACKCKGRFIGQYCESKILVLPCTHKPAARVKLGEISFLCQYDYNHCLVACDCPKASGPETADLICDAVGDCICPGSFILNPKGQCVTASK